MGRPGRLLAPGDWGWARRFYWQFWQGTKLCKALSFGKALGFARP